jgi:hypothetical protein
MKYDHTEAFCLMKYATDDGSEVEWIWNSRDGVTPFTIRSRSDNDMAHVDWQYDRRFPEYKPLPGERIFVDYTEEDSREFRSKQIEEYWDDKDYPISKMYETKEEALEGFVKEDMARPGQPMVIEAKDWKK